PKGSVIEKTPHSTTLGFGQASSALAMQLRLAWKEFNSDAPAQRSMSHGQKASWPAIRSGGMPFLLRRGGIQSRQSDQSQPKIAKARPKGLRQNPPPPTTRRKRW